MLMLRAFARSTRFYRTKRVKVFFSFSYFIFFPFSFSSTLISVEFTTLTLIATAADNDIVVIYYVILLRAYRRIYVIILSQSD